jgi:pimeloyl-ACP methyl ester carboxylesterase
MHPAPPAPDEARIRFQDFSGIDGEWLTFESGWEPLPDSPGQMRWGDERQNHIVRAGLLRHGGSQPRPWLVLVHGAEMGRSFDARLLRAKRLYDTLGVNVIMPVLPKHGPRRGAGETIRGSFPGIDLVENFHGLAQATWDVRRSIAWVREQDPTAVGVFGFSLGGYLSAMLAGLEPELDALIVGCPAVDLVDLFVRNMPSLQNGKSRLDKLFGRAALAYTPVAPLEMPTVLDKDRLGLIAALADQLADPIDHVSRLWHLWDRPEIHWIASGHVSYFLRNKPIDVLEHMLIGRGVGEIDLT